MAPAHSALAPLFLVNPGAGAGRAEAHLRTLLPRLVERGLVADVVRVTSVDDACVALRGLEPGRVPVATGGDGTVSLVAAALCRNGMRDVAIAILPVGTGNILARTLGVHRPDQAVRALQHGAVRRIDVMRTSHPLAPVALVSVSGGFEGRFLDCYSRFRRFGRPLGAFAAVPLARKRTVGMNLQLDGDAVVQTDDPVFSAGLYNTPFYVGGAVMSPGADIADGSGEGVVYWTSSAYWRAVWAGLRGGARSGAPGILRRAWRVARIESEGTLQIDGEPVRPQAMSVWMEPAALSVLVPSTGTS